MQAGFSPVRPGDAFVMGAGLFGVVRAVDEERGLAIVILDSGRACGVVTIPCVIRGRDDLTPYEVTADLLEAQQKLAAAKARYGFV